MEMRRLDRNTYDVFLGNQWSTWVRVRQGKGGTYRIAGQKVDHRLLKELDSILAPNMPITYGQTTEEMLHNINAINMTRQ